MSNFYCAAPWRGLHINPRGDVKTCCAGNPNMLGNLNTQTIEQILNSDLMAEIRSSLAKGQPHEYCSNCVKAERFGADSERQWHNNVNPDFDYDTAGNQYHYPVIVDVRWNTTCNLSCNYCGESCSSKWASIKGIPFKSGARPYYDSVCDFIEQHYEHIHEVALVGGEPLLLPENNRLLDVIPKDAIVTLITNLNVDLESNKIFQKLSTRNKVGWSMSFDNTGERVEYVRHGASWALIKQNLAKIKHLMNTQGHWGGIHAVYNLYNATRICELRQFAEDTGTTVLWQNLFQPDYLDPFLHGAGVAREAIAEIERFYAMNIATPAERQFFDNALTTYQNRLSVNKISKIDTDFWRHIHDNETKYHPDKAGEFQRLWPELAFLCDSMKITPVDEYNNLFEVKNIISHNLMQKVLATPWLDLPWVRQEGQEHWLRRRIINDHIPWIDEWNDHINTMWPTVSEAIGRKLEISYGTTWWIDEPGFTCNMHTDGDLKGAMQIVWIAAHEQLGTGFYHDKNGSQLRKQFLSIPNTGYMMLNFPRKNGLTHLHWHGMFQEVPPGTFRLSSYTLLSPSKQ